MGPVYVIQGLLDTHPLLWVLAGDERLPGWLRDGAERDPARFAVSDVSMWEIAIKCSTGKLRVPDDLPETVEDLGFSAVSVTRSHAWAVRDLPLHHRDPFDRLLIAQARDLGIPLITADAALADYDVATIWQ